MKWLGLLLILTSCTTTVTITPLKHKQYRPPVHHQYRSSRNHVQATPIPKPSISPLPPDERVIDIIRQLDKAKKL